MKVWIYILFCSFSLSPLLIASQYDNNYSNPLKRIINEQKYLLNNSSLIHPTIDLSPFTGFQFSTTTFFNSGYTNIDNNGAIIAYPKFTSYSLFSYEVLSRYFYLKFSPIARISSKQSRATKPLENFDFLNGKKNPIINNLKLNQSTLALHYKGLALGVSNENMWFGPGFHSSLSLSNNSEGFKHYFVGTLNQKKISNLGLNFRYFLSERLNYDNSIFYHTALAASLTIYKEPIITLGFSRVYLSGGFDEISWTKNDAAKIVFEPLFGENKTDLDYVGNYENEPEYWDPWDQLLTGFINFNFPQSNLDLYLEFGTDDSRSNFSDLKAHWNHASGYIFGIKKRFFLNKKSIFLGLEFMSNSNTTNTLNPSFFRGSWNVPNFYNRDTYLFSSYQGRRWAAHSGSDSDDKIVMLGIFDKNYFAILSYNLERHGINSMEYPELKHEVVLRLSREFEQFTFSVYLESEKTTNYNFISRYDPEKSRVIGFNVYYSMFSD